MTLLSATVLRGCNVHHEATVIRQEIDLGQFAHAMSGAVSADFGERFRERFLVLPRFAPEHGGNGEFMARLMSEEGVPIIEALFEAILALEGNIATLRRVLDLVEYAEVVAPDDDSETKAGLIWATNSPAFSREIARAAVIGVNELLKPMRRRASNGTAQSFDEILAALHDRARRKRLSPTTTLLIQTAKRRRIPLAYLGQSFIRLGEGRHQKLLQASISGLTGYTAASFSVNKRLTNRRLMELRLPIARQLRVATVSEALEAAEMLGFPLVVKPENGKKGTGITTDVRDEKELEKAFDLAQSEAEGGTVLEEHLAGQDYRLLVIGGKFTAALTRRPPTVTGDGSRSIAELVQDLNKDPFRDDLRLTQVPLDNELDEHLATRGYDVDHVLAVGEKLALRSVANVSKGGVPIDVTDDVHPDYRQAAERAARGVGLDVAGIDFMTTDISRSYREVGGGIIEVNARPGLCMHTWPRHGTPRDVCGPILDMMYPNGSSGRVTTAVVLGDQRSAVVARDVDEFLRTSGTSPALVIRRTAYLNGQRAELKDRQKSHAAQVLLGDPETEALVVTMSPSTAVRRGLQVRATDAAAIMDPTRDADIEEYSRSVELLARSNRGKIVVRARNRTALEALEAVPRDRLVLVSTRGLTRAVRRHLEAGGHAVVVSWEGEARSIVVHHGDETLATIPVSAVVPAKNDDPTVAGEAVNATGHRSGRIGVRMIAVGIAYGMGFDGGAIVRAVAAAPPVTG